MRELKTYMKKILKVQKLKDNIVELQTAYEELINYSAAKILSLGDEFTFKYENLNVIYDAIKLNITPILTETDNLRIDIAAQKLVLKSVNQKFNAKELAIIEAKENYCKSTTAAEISFNEMTQAKENAEFYINAAYQTSQKDA